MIGAFIALALTKVVSSLVGKEVEGWLDQVPFAVLRLARRQLPEDMRVPIHDEEWVPELYHIQECEQARPITRLCKGLRYSTSLLGRIGQTVRAGRPSLSWQARIVSGKYRRVKMLAVISIPQWIVIIGITLFVSPTLAGPTVWVVGLIALFGGAASGALGFAWDKRLRIAHPEDCDGD
ncbi:hypothetical protein [Nocardia alni]|uniref:hypothetical protein n=1 Tax=Nocardia alni TaxID=2815723 RepID=UPI001C24794F|nr:hypothetical protein [Nocardia alni]